MFATVRGANLLSRPCFFIQQFTAASAVGTIRSPQYRRNFGRLISWHVRSPTFTTILGICWGILPARNCLRRVDMTSGPGSGRFGDGPSGRVRARNTMSRVPAPQLRRRPRRALNRDEIGQLFEVVSSRRDRALMAIPLDTGIRLGELVSPVWSRVQDSGHLVTGKTGDRTVPISSHVRELMAGLGDEHHTWTGLKGPLTHYGVQGAIPASNVQGWHYSAQSRGPHVLRHTFGLHYVLAGGDPFSLQQIMEHRNIQSTMIYVYMSNQYMNERHAHFSPLAAFKF